jgi:peptidoglycan hydrolase CwlO-like protein
MIHELKVHQVELEMQNEDLQATRAQLEKIYAQYADLYDNAPVGYVTSDAFGEAV